jgi:hypothetical protein
MKKLLLLCIVTVLCAAPRASHAFSSFKTAFNTRYGTAGTRLDSCQVCHGASTSTWNPYGDAVFDRVVNLGEPIATALANIEPVDSDGDSFNNLTEIQARTFPGDPNDKPVASTPVIQVTPSSLNLASIQTGTTTDGVFTVRNTGGGTLSGGASVSAPFSIVGTATYSLGSNQTQAITVRFSPSGAGTYSNMVTFTGGAGTSNLVTASAFAPSPVIQVTPSSLNLASIQTGTTTDGVFTVRNTGGGTLSGGASVSAPFSIIGTATYSLGSNQTQAITVRFSPSGTGTYSNRVTFTGGAGISNLVTATAFAPSPVIQVTPSSLNLGSIQSGTTTDGVFTVRNTGGGTLSGGASVSAPFSIIGTATYSLGSNQTQAITVRFSPSGAGTYSNRVTFTGGAGTSNLVSGSAFASWQADILRARPDGRQQLLWRHFTGVVADGQVSLWTLNTNATLQSAATFGPYSDWSVADMPVSRFDNTPHLVWTNTTGAISIWNLDSSGSFASAQNYGPYSGWSYRAVAISSTNNDQWVLWTHTTGQASLWRLSSNSVLQATSALGPFTGWSAEELAISPVDGKVRLLWRHTDGTQSLWRLSSDGAFEAANTFGPFTGWSVQTLTLGPADNQVRLLWENPSGAISLWRLTTNDTYEASTTYGPFSGWQSLGLTMRPDNKLQLPWDHTSDHAFSLWRLSITETLESAPTFGPYPSWQVWDGDVDGTNKVHLLWRNANGQISLWRLSPTGTIENATNFGPY